MIRRPFDFPDSKEGQVRARLTFDGDHLATIVNMENNRQFGFFRLDPRLITMISSPNGEQRLFVPRSGFPDLLVDTLLATEDRHFYEHDGDQSLLHRTCGAGKPDSRTHGAGCEYADATAGEKTCSSPASALTGVKRTESLHGADHGRALQQRPYS